jgi:hypothetical protein
MKTNTKETTSMTKLLYTGPADIRKIGKRDFELVGVEDQDAISLPHKDGSFEIDLSDAAAQHLLTNDGTNWSVVKDEAQEPKK